MKNKLLIVFALLGVLFMSGCESETLYLKCICPDNYTFEYEYNGNIICIQECMDRGFTEWSWETFYK